MMTTERKKKAQIVTQTSSQIAHSKSFSHFNFNSEDPISGIHQTFTVQSCLILVMVPRGSENNIMLHLNILQKLILKEEILLQLIESHHTGR